MQKTSCGKLAVLIIALIVLQRGRMATAEPPAHIPDPVLKAKCEEALRVTDPTPTDLRRLTGLTVMYAGLCDLTGLEHAVNIERLSLSGNDITDLSALSNMTRLTYLNLEFNAIADIQALSGLAELRDLNLRENSITDMTPLSELVELLYLRIDNNQVRDISSLSALTKLRCLWMASNRIGDISSLSGLTTLWELCLTDNVVQDLSALSELPGLTTLELSGNSIGDISPLSHLAQLTELGLGVNPISDLSALAGLTKLRRLSLQCTDVSDIMALATLANLEELYLNDNAISDITALASLTKLTRLYLEHNKISDISALAALTGLESLNLSFNPLELEAYTIHFPQIEENNPGIEIHLHPHGMNRTLRIWSTPGGSVLAPGTGSHSFRYASTVTIEAQAAAGYTFVCWSGTAADAGRVEDANAPVTTVFVDDDYTLGAHFTCSGQTVVYVDAKASGANDGSSWESAYRHIQDALAIASCGTEIRVAGGVYRPDQGLGIEPGDRTASFHMISGVTLQGGYGGAGAPEPNARDVETYETILSGDLDGNDDPNAYWISLGNDPTRAENSYHVVIAEMVDETAILDGLTITAGHASGLASDGAGLDCIDSHPTLRDCTFRRNCAESNGGGMNTFVRDEDEGPFCRPTLENCAFTENVARSGGGLYVDEQCEPVLTDCTFKDNFATGKGGGMIAWDDSELTLVGCTFSGNRSGRGGGGLFQDSCDSSLTDCTFIHNAAAEDGGGMFTLGDHAILTGCTFVDNTAQNRGAGLYGAEAHLTLADCIIQDNYSSGGGGGMYCSRSTVEGSECLFLVNSTCREGGAIANHRGNLTLTNCVVSANRAVCSLYEITVGGGIFTFGDERHCLVALTNCTFWGNSAAIGNALACDSYLQMFPSSVEITNCILWDESDPIFNSDDSTIAVTYSDVSGGWPGQGNLSVHPRLERFGHWDYTTPPGGVWDPSWVGADYRLRPDSPCIDAGDPASGIDPNAPQTDIYGGPRIVGGRIDMGAAEFNPPGLVDLPGE